MLRVEDFQSEDGRSWKGYRQPLQYPRGSFLFLFFCCPLPLFCRRVTESRQLSLSLSLPI